MTAMRCTGAMLLFVWGMLSPLTIHAWVEVGPITSTGHRCSFVSTIIDADGDIHLCHLRVGKVYYKRQVAGVRQSEHELTLSSPNNDFYPYFSLDGSPNAHFADTLGSGSPVRYQKFTAASGTFSNPEDVIVENVAGNDTNRCGIAPTVTCSWWHKAIGASSGIGNSSRRGGRIRGRSFTLLVRGTDLSHDHVRQHQLPISLFSLYWVGGSNAYLGVNQKQNLSTNAWKGTTTPELLDGLPFVSHLVQDTSGNVHVTWLEWDPNDSEQFNGIGYLTRDGQAYGASWEPEKRIYYQSLIVASILGSPEPPSPRIAVTPDGDICVAFARMMMTSICDDRYLMKEWGEDWPVYDYFNPPPEVGESPRESYPGIAADPRRGQRKFIIA